MNLRMYTLMSAHIAVAHLKMLPRYIFNTLTYLCRVAHQLSKHAHRHQSPLSLVIIPYYIGQSLFKQPFQRRFKFVLD